jgi:hypothetical protein
MPCRRGRDEVTRRALALVAALAAASALGAACAAPLEDRERFTGGGGCPDGVAVEEVLASRCAGGICHSAGDMPGGGLDLLSEGAVERVAGVESPNCEGEVLAVPGDPDGSLIVRKLGDDPPCGDRMPLAGALEGGEEACIREWIEDMVQGGD